MTNATTLAILYENEVRLSLIRESNHTVKVIMCSTCRLTINTFKVSIGLVPINALAFFKRAKVFAILICLNSYEAMVRIYSSWEGNDTKHSKNEVFKHPKNEVFKHPKNEVFTLVVSSFHLLDVISWTGLAG